MPLATTEKENEAYIDGSSKGFYGYYLNGVAFIIKENTPMTNNKAEWTAFLTLVLDLPHGWKGTVYSDSLLLVNQFNGLYRIKDPELKRLNDMCKSLCHQKNLDINLVWIPREKNILGKRLDKELVKERKASWIRERERQYT